MVDRVRTALIGLALAALTGAAHARPLFCEGIDAGSQPATATTVTGAGSVTGIGGSLSSSLVGGDFEDMYLISITDTVIFEARTVEPKDPTTPTFNTQLWLFSAAPAPVGLGLLGNDDAQPGGPGFPGSSLLLPMSDDGTGVLLTPGEYYLAISGFNNVPLAEGPGGLQPIFEFFDPFEVSGPDGPSGMNPIVDWSGEGETGAYLILLSGVTFLPCGEVPCSGTGIPEEEPCGGDQNGGCNAIPPAFQPVPCNATICGTSQAGETGLGFRDTDWYQVDFTVPSRIITRGLAQFPHGQGLIEYQPGFEGSGNCADLTGFVNPVALGDPCQESLMETPCLPPGIYFLFVSQQEFEDNLCGFGTNDYTLEIQCVPCSTCPADFDHSGDVGFVDLLTLLAAWGPCAGCIEDLDGSGDVGFVDLLTLLAAWGPCP